jgi:hypothetical protein
VKIVVYVEGPSDVAALMAVLRDVLAEAHTKRAGISFLKMGGKTALLDQVPRAAADHLAQHPRDWVFALPDLYPMSSYRGTPNEHASFEDLEKLLRGRFEARAAGAHVSDDARRRFRVHCLKHDLEALLLAAPDSLRRRLGTTDSLRDAWRKPVEDQDDERPPKRVVEELFKKYRRKPGYVDTSDAPWILERATPKEVVDACPQRFAPFVADLRAAVGEAEG